MSAQNWAMLIVAASNLLLILAMTSGGSGRK